MKAPCPDCPEFLSCEAMKLLVLAIELGIDKGITAINCPKCRMEFENEKTSVVIALAGLVASPS